MKALRIFLLVCLLLWAAPAQAGVTNLDSLTLADDLIVGGTTTLTGAATIGTATVTTGNITTATITTLNHSRERGFTLPLTSFLIMADGSVASPITASTVPGLQVDDSIPNIVWADANTTPVAVTFRIPADYSSGGAWRLYCTESNSTTPNQVDFDVYINRNGVLTDSSAYNQTPVALAGTLATPSVVTLQPNTEFTAYSLAAGDWVTLRIWRDNTADGTGDLEIKGVDFYYTATD